jgi:hypothetical protein
MRRPIQMAVLGLLCATGSPALAQSPNTATVVVVVVDQTGGVVKDAQVRVVSTGTGTSREATSGADGSATVAALPLTGSYTVSVSKAGFTAEDVKDVLLRAGETATIKVKLLVNGGESEVTVYGTAEGVRRDPQLGQRLDSDQIDETPVLGRKITSLPLLNAAFRSAKGTGDLFVNATYFVTGAGGRRQPAITLDGATNDDPWGRQTMMATVPVGAVQEMTVLSHAFSAEFGWTASAAVNLVSKAGTNQRHGELLFLARPGGLQTKTLGTDNWCPPSVPSCAAPANADGSTAGLTPADIPDSLAQVSGAWGGPLAKDRTFFFGAFDYTHQDRTAPITSPLSPVSSIVGHYRQVLADGRMDHQLSLNNRMMLRVNLDRFYDTNPQDAVSNNVLPSAGRRFTRHTWSVQANETAVLGPTMLNEARFAYLDGDPITNFEAIQPSTQFTRAGAAPFTAGESRRVKVFSRVAQLSDTLTWTRHRHSVRLGGSLARSSSGGDGTEFGSAFTLGQFTVLSSTTRPLDQLTLSDMQRYQQSFDFGKGRYVLNQWLGAAFAQDSYRVRDDLTLDLGLRYDVQSFSDARGDVAPRVGFAWNPRGDANTVVRGGYGLYYTQLRANTAASFELGGPEGVFTYQASPGQTGFPACLPCTPVLFDPNAALGTLPARNITIRPGMSSYYQQFFDVARLTNYPDTLVNPKSQVTSIGFERQILPGVFVQADYVHQHWTDLDRSVDLNAPSYFDRTAPGQSRSTAAADATRPIAPVNGGFRAINVIENLGVADYDALQTMVSYRAGARVYASVSYTLSKATNTSEPDGNGIGPNDQNRLGAEERGPSLLDQRHRAVITFSCRLPYNLTAGTVTQLASARPFNSTTGADNNGDGSNNDRPVIDGKVIGKSAFRGTAISDVSTFLEGRLHASAGRTVLLRVEAFNLFNHANILGRQATFGNTATPNANFGQASAGLANSDPGRMVQFHVRFQF